MQGQRRRPAPPATNLNNIRPFSVPPTRIEQEDPARRAVTFRFEYRGGRHKGKTQQFARMRLRVLEEPSSLLYSLLIPFAFFRAFPCRPLQVPAHSHLTVRPASATNSMTHYFLLFQIQASNPSHVSSCIHKSILSKFYFILVSPQLVLCVPHLGILAAPSHSLAF
jgi:hypothetical protein